MSEISVSVNGEGVASGVRVIEGNLKSLDSDVKKTFSLFEQFNTGLKGIATTNLNTVIKNLDKFNNVMKLMNATNYSNVASGLSNLSNALSTIGKVSFGNVSADMKALSKSIIAVDKIEFNRVAAGVRELKTGLELMGKTSISKASSDLAVLEKSLKGLAKADYDLVSLGVKEISSSLKILSAINFSAIVADLEKFNQSLSSIKGNKLSGTIRDLSNSTKVLTTTLANQTKSVINSSNALAKYESKVASTSKANHSFNSSVGSSTMGLGLLNSAILAVTANLGAREIIAYADSWKQVTNLVKLATTSEAELISTRQRLIAISLDTRTDISAQATLYNRLNIAQKELGVTSSEIMSVIHNVGRALGVTSTSALEARGALIQLSQAFGQDIVRAEEFNSIMEGTPKVARAIADGMEISISQLRKLVLAGVVTNKEIFNSLQSQGSELKAEYEKVEKTISGAFTNLKTAVTVAIGTFDDGTGASKRFADSIVNLSEMIMKSNLDVFAKDIESAGKQVIAILALIGLAKGTGGLIGSIYALNTALLAAEGRWLQLNLAMKSNLVVMGFLSAYMAAGYLDKKFGETFGIGAATKVQKFNGSIYALQLTLKETEKAAGDKDLITKILGKDPKKLESSLSIVNTEISKLKKELTSFQKGDVPVMQSQIPAKEADIKRLQDLVDGVNKLKTANQQSITAEALANEKRAEAAQVLSNAKTKQYLEWEKEKDSLKERIKLGKQASDLLVKPDKMSASSKEKLLALEISGNEAKKRAYELLPDQILREKELGSEHKNTIDQIQREISANAGLGNARESALKAQVSQGERLKNLMPDLEELAAGGNLQAVNLLKQFTVEIDKSAVAAKTLEQEFGNAVVGGTIGLNDMVRKAHELSEASKEIAKNDLKGDKMKSLLPDLDEAAASGSTRAIKILKELEAQIKLTDAAHAKYIATYGQAPPTFIEQMVAEVKRLKKELPGALERIEKLKEFQLEAVDILPALEEADLQGYESAAGLIDDLRESLRLAAIEQAKLELEFGKVQTDPIVAKIQNLKDYIKEVQKSAKISEKLEDMRYSFTDSMENFESGNEYADSILKSGFAIIDMLKEQQDQEKELAKIRLEASKLTDPKERAKRIAEANEIEAEGPKRTLSAYQNLFGTLSSLAKENSKEQEALHKVQMAFAIAEMAMNAKVALTTGVEGVLTQFKGDPYTAFARVAAAAASVGSLLAMIGVSFSGFSGGSSGASAPVKASYQTGTVLGDSSASSESVSNIVEMLDDIHADEYRELQGIYSEMKDLNSNITGLVSSIYRGGDGGFTAKDMGINLEFEEGWAQKEVEGIFSSVMGSGGLVGKSINMLGSVVGSIIGGGTKTYVDYQGITTKELVSISDLLAGKVIDAQQFVAGTVKTKGGWFSSDEYDPFRNVAEIGESEEQQKTIDNMFTNLFSSLGKTFVDIAVILGKDVKTVQEYAFQIGDIDLKNLETAGEINEALNAAISSISDEAATTLFTSLIGQYQTVGEGMVETAVRVASEKIIVLETVERLGSAFKDADVPALAIEFSQSLLNIAGGLEAFTEAANTYYDKFFTDEEKQADIGELLTASLKDFKIDLPDTRELYRGIVEGIDITTESGQKAYMTMLKLSDTADQYYSYLEDASEKSLESAQKINEDAIAKAQQLEQAIQDANLSIAQVLQGSLTTSQMFLQWSIVNSEAQDLFNEMLSGGISTEELEEAVKAFSKLGVEGDELTNIIGYLTSTFVNAANQLSQAIKSINDIKTELPTTGNLNQTSADVFKKAFDSFLKLPSLASVIAPTDQYKEVEKTKDTEIAFNESIYLLNKMLDYNYDNPNAMLTTDEIAAAINERFPDSINPLIDHFIKYGKDEGVSPFAGISDLGDIKWVIDGSKITFTKPEVYLDKELIPGSGKEIQSSEAEISKAIDLLSSFSGGSNYQGFFDAIAGIDSNVLYDIFGEAASTTISGLGTAYRNFLSDANSGKGGTTTGITDNKPQIDSIMGTIQTYLDTVDLSDFERQLYDINAQASGWVTNLTELGAAKEQIDKVELWRTKQIAEAQEAWDLGLLQSKLGLENQLYTLQKDDVKLREVVIQQRAIELKALDETLRPLQEAIWLLEDESTVLDSITDKKESYLDLLQQEIDIRKEAYDTARQSLEDYVDREEELIKVRRDAAKSIDDFINELKGSNTTAPGQSLEFFEKRYTSLLENARKATPEELGEAVSALTGFTSEYLDFASAYGGDYQTLFDQVTKDLSGLSVGFTIDADKQTTALQSIKDILKTSGEDVFDLKTAVATYLNAERALAETTQWQVEIDKLSGISSVLDRMLKAQLDYYDSITKDTVDSIDTTLLSRVNNAFNGGAINEPTFNLLKGRFDSDGNILVPGDRDKLDSFLKIKGFADGGIATGPLSGYQTTLHGTEAVIPLKNGFVPVQINSGNNNSNQNITVIVRVGNKELQDMTTEIIRTNPEAQRQIRRVANG